MLSSKATNEMSSRKRFRETMAYGTPDRTPYFEEGIRKEVIKAWRRQGLPKKADLSEMFPSDLRERMEVDLTPRPGLRRWPTTMAELDTFQQHLNPLDKKRLPQKWSKRVSAWKHRDHVLMLYVHRGFFQTMGVRDWQRFEEVIYLLIDQPDLVRRMMAIQGEFSATLTEKVLKEVQIDAAVFSEPIGGNDRPLISPQMYEQFVLKSYEPVLNVLNRYNVETIIFQTFANAKILIPSILRWGFNCLWACEVNIEAMDYRSIRQDFGRDLRLIGGIDLDALRKDEEAIRREIETKVPPLIQDGGYVPLADGRVREDVPFDNYVYYRKLLEKITQAGI
ncbi:MAG: uroporphyrinogen decarboxylase family protein [Desulfobacterales bacterium]|jgi:uroporphyrinogen decarboxylase